jgi:4-diphosphocytidyl-2-C-methyl-D-erythritol kinase
MEPGVQMTLHKNIPPGTGLGGGSSDAATTLRLLNMLFEDPLETLELLELAAGLGSDVPFFLLESGFALGWGRGDRTLEATAPEPREIVLVLPDINVSTRDAYISLSAAGLGPSQPRMIRGASLSDWSRIGSQASNDFERVAFSKHPLLGELRVALVGCGAEFARMSGSGSALFGVFEDSSSARAAAKTIGSSYACECIVAASRTCWTDIRNVKG